MTKFSAIGGAGVVMNIHTGEVLGDDLASAAQPERGRPGLA